MSKLFKNPPPWLLALIYIFTLSVSVVSIVLAVTQSTGIISYFVFGFAGIGLAYSVYTAIIFRKSIKFSVLKLANGNRFTRKYIESYGIRTLVSSTISFTVSVLFGIFNGILGIWASSVWYGALSLYYISAAIIYGILLLNLKSSNKKGYKIYRRCGYLMALLNVALSVSIAQMIFDSKGFLYGELTIYAFAAYAFYKITMAIIRLIKSRKYDNAVLNAIAIINLTVGMVSILALQTALLSAFGEGINHSLFNTLTGSAVSISSIVLSIYMIVNGTKKLNLEKENER